MRDGDDDTRGGSLTLGTLLFGLALAAPFWLLAAAVALLIWG